MTEFRGTLTPDLYIRALRLHGGFAPWFGALLLVLGIAGAVPGIRSQNTTAIVVPAAIMAGGVFILIYPRFFASRAYRTNALVRDGFSATAGETELAVRSPYGTSNIPWEKFHQAVTGKEMVLLYLSAQQFLIIPRAFFASDDDWSAFQTLASSA